MKIEYYDDAKGKSMSHEVAGDVLISDWNGHFNISIQSYGAYKEEAYDNFYDQIRQCITHLKVILEENERQSHTTI